MVKIQHAGSEFKDWLSDLKTDDIVIGCHYTYTIIGSNHVIFTARPGNEDLELIAKLRWGSKN